MPARPPCRGTWQFMASELAVVPITMPSHQAQTPVRPVRAVLDHATSVARPRSALLKRAESRDRAPRHNDLHWNGTSGSVFLLKIGSEFFLGPN